VGGAFVGRGREDRVGAAQRGVAFYFPAASSFLSTHTRTLAHSLGLPYHC